MAQLTAGQRRYREYLKSPRWRLLRWLRKVRDGGVCRDCLKRGIINRRHLQVHHTQYDNKGESFWADFGDLVTLCADCHARRHGKRVAND